jgi:hypothetical protein
MDDRYSVLGGKKSFLSQEAYFQTCPVVHTASYPTDSESPFPDDKET